MKLYIIDYNYKHIHKYSQAVVMADSELDACTRLHKKHTIGVMSHIVIVHVTESLDGIVETK